MVPTTVRGVDGPVPLGTLIKTWPQLESLNHAQADESIVNMNWNEVSVYRGITCLQGPPFHTWPGGYRLFHVYKDRMEWEVRQVVNRGFVRECLEPTRERSTALSWRISVADDDLTGQISYQVQRTEP